MGLGPSKYGPGMEAHLSPTDKIEKPDEIEDEVEKDLAEKIVRVREMGCFIVVVGVGGVMGWGYLGMALLGYMISVLVL